MEILSLYRYNNSLATAELSRSKMLVELWSVGLIPRCLEALSCGFSHLDSIFDVQTLSFRRPVLELHIPKLIILVNEGRFCVPRSVLVRCLKQHHPFVHRQSSGGAIVAMYHWRRSNTTRPSFPLATALAPRSPDPALNLLHMRIPLNLQTGQVLRHGPDVDAALRIPAPLLPSMSLSSLLQTCS